MKKRNAHLAICISSLLMCAMIAAIMHSRFSFTQVFSSDTVIWHHYNKKLPTQSENGIKEYWIRCGGNYQFVAPTSGTIIDKGSNYDTSEFSVDDDRWLTYCDEYGHTLDSYEVCNFCGKLDESEKASDTAINGATKKNSTNPLKGFNNVYQRTVSRGAEVGVTGNISSFTYIYYALMQTSENELYVYGGDTNYASLTQNVWTYFLLVRNNNNALSLYTRTSLSESWTNKKLDEADTTHVTFSKLRFYNWVNTSYTVYCSEIYTSEKEIDTCSHTYDAHDVCTQCMKLKNSNKVADYAVSGSTSVEFTKASGFRYVSSVTGKSNGANGINLDISNYESLYFALYADTKSVRPFSGGDDGDGSHRIVWSGRWWYLLVEKDNGVWNAYIRESGTATWYTRTIDANTTTNFSTLLSLYYWPSSELEGITIYNTEIYATRESTQPVEQAQTINIGVWNGSYHFTSTSSIDDLVNAGFNTTIGINPTWHSNWNSILNYSATKGIKHIVDPRGWDYDNSCYADWDGIAPSYANHSAVEGFVMWDEPSTTKFSQIAQMKQTFKSVMPSDKLFFVNLLSSACGLYMLYGTNNATSSYAYYETNYAKAYHNTVNPDIYSYDSYPIFTNGEIRKSYFCNFDIWSDLSRTNGIPTWYSLLSSAHQSGDGDGYVYGLPTQKQLEWQMSCAITFGITNLMHYIYASDASDYSCMANVDGTKNEYYNTVSDANNNIHALDNDLANYGWEGAATYHNLSKTNLLFKGLQHTLSLSQIGVSSVNATYDCLIGSYIDGNNNRAYMVTNSGYSIDYSSTWSSNYTSYNANVAYVNEANTVYLTVDDTITGADIIQNGVKTHVSASNNTIALNLESYGSAFVIPTK